MHGLHAGEVAIVGYASTRFGVLHERGYLDLLAEAAPGAVDSSTVETNIVVVETDAAADIVAACREPGVLLSLLDRRHLRAVTHLDVDDDDVEQAASVLGPLVRQQ